MKEEQLSADWSAARGDKWYLHAERMEAMLASVDEPLIRAAQLDRPCRIADIGCGGGATARELLRLAPSESVVHGYDISAELIDLARRKQPPSPDIAFEVADVAKTVPASAPYDRLVSRASTMFFDDPPAAFSNLLQWLAPGGRFAFAVWGPPEQNPSGIIRRVVNEVVGLPPLNPKAPGPFRYANSEDLTTVLNAVGFTNIRVNHWSGLLPVGGGLGAAEGAEFVLASFANYAELLAAASPEATPKARQLMTARFAPHEVGGIVRLPASAHIITGSGRS
jgi:SAM-dependent methyltransferase